MKKYYVNLPGGTRDAEYQQVLDLLKVHENYNEEDGRDYQDARQPDGTFERQGFLYLFDDRAKADRFRDIVRNQTKNQHWATFEVDVGPIEEMVEDSRDMPGEPLLLAIYYDAGDAEGDVSLLEVIDNFGANGIDPNRDLFKMTLDSTPSFPIGPGRRLRMILTNPREFHTAIKEDWEGVSDIRRAVSARRYRTLFANDEGKRILDLIDG